MRCQNTAFVLSGTRRRDGSIRSVALYLFGQAVKMSGPRMRWSAPPLRLLPFRLFTAALNSVQHGLSERVWPFQLPTLLIFRLAPRAMSFNREMPRHMTMLPGGGSLARAR